MSIPFDFEPYDIRLAAGKDVLEGGKKKGIAAAAAAGGGATPFLTPAGGVMVGLGVAAMVLVGVASNNQDYNNADTALRQAKGATTPGARTRYLDAFEQAFGNLK